jgi:hypothetical protein
MLLTSIGQTYASGVGNTDGMVDITESEGWSLGISDAIGEEMRLGTWEGIEERMALGTSDGIGDGTRVGGPKGGNGRMLLLGPSVALP